MRQRNVCKLCGLCLCPDYGESCWNGHLTSSSISLQGSTGGTVRLKQTTCTCYSTGMEMWLGSDNVASLDHVTDCCHSKTPQNCSCEMRDNNRKPERGAVPKVPSKHVSFLVWAVVLLSSAQCVIGQSFSQETDHLPAVMEEDHHRLQETDPDGEVMSFSSSSYPHYIHRSFSPDDLRHLYRSVGCVDDEIHVECMHDSNATVVIENATFYSVPGEHWLNCSRGPLGPMSVGLNDLQATGKDNIFAGQRGFSSLANIRDLRQALNRRCSGMSKGQQCFFNLQLDHSESVPWGAGIVDIYYRCVPSDITYRYCNSDVRINDQTYFQKSSSQFLLSPVYPKYYVGGRKCRWTLRADPGQRIQLRFLDISLRERLSSSEPECTDSIRVSERGKTLLRMCGESKEDILLLSQANKLEVRLETQAQGIFPRRGILAEFWPIGCATPREPGYGYLHLRNDTHATYTCSVGHVFQDTLERSKTVVCYQEDGRWSDSVANCVSLQYLRKYGNSTVRAILTSKELSVQRGGTSQRITIVPPLSAAWFSDIVIPTVIVSVVVVVSLFAVIVLLLLRRHMQLEGHDAAYHRENDDRNALTPGSVRRCTPPILHNPNSAATVASSNANAISSSHTNNSGVVMHIDLERQREELFLC